MIKIGDKGGKKGGDKGGKKGGEMGGETGGKKGGEMCKEIALVCLELECAHTCRNAINPCRSANRPRPIGVPLTAHLCVAGRRSAIAAALAVPDSTICGS